MQAIYRVIDFTLNEYKNSVIGEVESEYGYNLHQLEKRLKILKDEKIYLPYEKDIIFKKLHEVYLNKGDLHAKVYSIDLYSSELEKLTSMNVLTTIKVNEPFEHYKYEIQNKREFTNLARSTIRSFLCIVYWLERRNFILNYASKIERENKVLSEQIIKTIEKLRERKIITNNLDRSTKRVKDNFGKTMKEHRYRSFYSTQMDKLRRDKFNELNLKMDDICNFAIKAGFISKNTSGKLLLDFFTKKSLAQNQKIVWEGTAFELRDFTQRIGDTGICNEIKPRNSEKWITVMGCFHIKLRGKQMGPIEQPESISGAKPTNSDRLEQIKTLVNKIIDAAQN
jgi:hypothetical protein